MCFFRLWIMDSETPSDKPDELEIYRQWAESGRSSNDRIWQKYRMFGSIFYILTVGSRQSNRISSLIGLESAVASGMQWSMLSTGDWLCMYMFFTLFLAILGHWVKAAGMLTSPERTGHQIAHGTGMRRVKIPLPIRSRWSSAWEVTSYTQEMKQPISIKEVKENVGCEYARALSQPWRRSKCA